MSVDVTVIDYGRGNLLSVSRALEHCGATVKFAETPSDLERTGHLVLPGVGAFSDAMTQLRKQDLIDSLKDHSEKERPLLGICLGMQILLDRGEEFGDHDGLGLIAGNVTAIADTGLDGQSHKIPHIGWNKIYPAGQTTNWSDSVFQKTRPGSAVYFVHSFNCEPTDPNARLADCQYNGRIISAATRVGNTFGCQFHPEKSGKVGLEILDQFLKQ